MKAPVVGSWDWSLGRRKEQDQLFQPEQLAEVPWQIQPDPCEGLGLRLYGSI